MVCGEIQVFDHRLQVALGLLLVLQGLQFQ